jgi:hypothetical protein
VTSSLSTPDLAGNAASRHHDELARLDWPGRPQPIMPRLA